MAGGITDREQNRHHLGEGILPLSCIVKSLRRAGYDGYYDVVLIGEEIERSDYCQLLECLKRAFHQLASV